MFKVFEVDDAFQEYEMSEFLVGAESLEDLLSHLPDIMILKTGSRTEGKKQAKKITAEVSWRVREIPHLLTDLPYEILNSSGYIE